METNIRSSNPLETFHKAKICEEIFDSVTIYIHITTTEDLVGLSKVTFSNVPFTDPTWKDNLHHMIVEDISNDSEDRMRNQSYTIHKKLMLDLGYLLTMRGHEIYVCVSQNPSDKNGEYVHFSKEIRNKINTLKDEALPNEGKI